jgi:hypothetical protein
MSDHSCTLEPWELRDIILGKVNFRRCPECQGKGETWYIEYTLKERPHDSDFIDPISEEMAANFSLDDHPEWDWAEACSAECETCKTVGYISNEISW